jgi:hypothetical protein
LTPKEALKKARAPIEELKAKVKGKEVFCLASGPSLTEEDVELVRRWRNENRLVFVANTTYRIAPWADLLFAMDPGWWDVHKRDVRSFDGDKYTSCAKMLAGVTRLPLHQFNNFGNSGAAIVMLASVGGASCVYLLGYDAKVTDKTHWHGDHPKPLRNAPSADKWPAKFHNLSKSVRTKVINCSRDTAIDAFPRMRLEDAIRPHVPAACDQCAA